MRVVLIFFVLLIINSCTEEKESCETRKDATIQVTNSFPYGFWIDVRTEVTELNDKHYLLPNETYTYTVEQGNYKICGSA